MWHERVTLRVAIVRSCNDAATGQPSCKVCQLSGTTAQRDICYASGCYCFGALVFAQAECVGAPYETRRRAYNCTQRDQAIILGEEALVSLAVFDLDKGSDGSGGQLIEQVAVYDHKYFKTPLRAANDDPVSSTLLVDQARQVFTATVDGTPTDDPSDPQALTDEQAARGVQFFFTPTSGYIEGVLSVLRTGTGACTSGRNFLLAGDSALCAPPPPSPALPPLTPPPPPSPPSPPPLPPPPPLFPCVGQGNSFNFFDS